jgi:uncharacterized surface protein with fasciclin (FAS1) repeats
MSGLSVASAAEQAGYRRFTAALQAADHLKTLQGSGPFTVFAPTDAAFEKFSVAALDRLMEDDRDLLRLVMGYHFAAGKVVAARFAGKRIRAVMHAGGDLIVDGRSGLRVNAAHVVEPDIGAENGVIHGIDSVLWPREAIAAAGQT